MENIKELMVFAGANGSGKSTIAKHFRDLGLCPLKFICPDQLVPVNKLNDYDSYIMAMQSAEILRFEAVSQSESFSFETVLSTQHKLDFIRFAKSEGYTITVIYVVTSDPGINLERIKRRVVRGGHDVPRDKVLSRYEKSMNLMFPVLEESCNAAIYDNSSLVPQIVLTKDVADGYVLFRENFEQSWVQKYFALPAKEKGVEIRVDYR